MTVGKDLCCLAHHGPVYTQGWLCLSPVHLLKPLRGPAWACLCRAVTAEGEVVDKGKLPAVADQAALDRIRSDRGTSVEEHRGRKRGKKGVQSWAPHLLAL